MRIAYLASTVTLPGSPDRRADAFEHDQTMAALRGPFRARGMELHDIAWDDPDARWEEFDAAIVGTAWDYWDRLPEFLATLARIEQRTRLFNPSQLIRWNGHKSYLRELETRGASVVPTVWLENPTPAAVADAFDLLDTRQLVLKRQVGACAEGQHLLKRGEAPPPLSQPMMAQPFLPSVLSEGELGFVFIDGEFCHAVLKRAPGGDYRVQSIYGGFEETTSPAAADRDAAAAVLALLDEPPLYARVDMLRSGSGELMLTELELAEPFLYPLQGPELGPRMAAALARRLARPATPPPTPA